MAVTDVRVQFIQINLQHAKASTHLLCSELAKLHTTIALIQEPWVLNNAVQGLTSIPNYKCFYFRSNNRPRAAIVVSNNIIAETLPQFTDRDLVAFAFSQYQQHNNSRPVIVASAYLPIDKDIPSPKLSALVSYCNQNRLSLILGCDSNAHNTVWGSSDTNNRGISLCDFLLSNDLEFANTGSEPTFVSSRGQSLIDLTITTSNILHKVKNWEVSSVETLSDHKLIKFVLHTNYKFPLPQFQNPKKLKTEKFLESITKANDKLDSLLSTPSSLSVITTKSLDKTVDTLSEVITTAFNAACPITKPKRAHTNSWWNRELEKLRSKTRQALQKAKRTPYPNDKIQWEAYRSLRRDYKKAILDSKVKSWQDFCSNTEGVSATAKLHKILCRDPSNALDWVRDSAGQPAVSPAQTIEILFNTNFPSNSVNQICEPPNQTKNCPNGPTTYEHLFTAQKIQWAIESFEPYKAPGPDGIYPICLQLALPYITAILQHVYKFSVCLSFVPTMWQNTKIIFIPKQGKNSYHEAKSFRPISLTCFLLKALERLIEFEIKTNVIPKSPLNCRQHAYTPDKSTDTALHQLCTKMSRALDKSNSSLCVFLDIQGAFDHTSPAVVTEALLDHNFPIPLTNFIKCLLSNRTISATHQGHTLTRTVSKGCPQGGILSPLLWNLVADTLLNLLTSHQIWCLGYADDIVITIEGSHIHTCFETAQFALSKIEAWCNEKSLSVNPEKAEALLVTRKRKYKIPDLSIFGKPIQLKKFVKYLGIYIDQKLTWSKHVEIKTEKAVKTLWVCKKAIGNRWGLGPAQILWLLHSIIHPLFLHGVVVWWEASTKTNHLSRMSKINRSTLLAATGAFKTTPTLALEYLMDVFPIDIKAKQLAINSWYRLLRTGIKVFPDCGHHKLHKLLNLAYDQFDQPADYTAKQILFPDCRIKFLYPSKEDWVDDNIDLSMYDILAYTDGSSNELGVGAGVFVDHKTKDHSIVVDDPNQSISLSNTSTIFQAEMLAISTASVSLLSARNLNIAIITDSLSALQSLQNPVTRTQTKLSCLRLINTIAESNQLSLLWVPSHSGVQGNERADELANVGAALETLGPDPVPPISHSHIKSKIREWSHLQFRNKWLNSPLAQSTKEILKYINIKTLPLLKSLRKPMIAQTMYTLTGHGPFRAHLVKLRLTDEPSCPKCGAVSDTNLHFLLSCPRYQQIRYSHLKMPKTIQPNPDRPTTTHSPKHCINVSNLADFVRLSDRFLNNRC